MTMVPFKMDAPGGMNSVMTSLMKPVLPVIFFMQFMYLYRYDTPLFLGFRGRRLRFVPMRLKLVFQ